MEPIIICIHFFVLQKNIYPRKTRHEKSRRIIYEFSYKMGVLNEKKV
jgi:hypothetical protein